MRACALNSVINACKILGVTEMVPLLEQQRHSMCLVATKTDLAALSGVVDSDSGVSETLCLCVDNLRALGISRNSVAAARYVYPRCA